MSEIGYTGRDNLSAMHAAKHYNAAILQVIEQAICGTRVIDFGAGDGLFADLVARRHAAPLCVEADHDLRQQLRTRGLDVCDTLATLASGRFDFAYSLNVLEHIDDDGAILRELRRCLRPGGRVLIFVPAFPLLYGAMDRQVGHVRRYRKLELGEKLSAAGFSVERLVYFDSLGFMAALAHRLLARNGAISPNSVAWYDRWIFPLSARMDKVLNRLIGKNLIAVARA